MATSISLFSSIFRIASLRNDTFSSLKEITKINLSGNRLTTTLRFSQFEENPYVRDIWLGDNPWRCECNSKGFYEFYNFLTEQPPKVFGFVLNVTRTVFNGFR